MLVSDMSGFSRVCKEEGILHFLANIKIMQAMCVPICEARGGVMVKVAADRDKREPAVEMGDLALVLRTHSATHGRSAVRLLAKASKIS